MKLGPSRYYYEQLKTEEQLFPITAQRSHFIIIISTQADLKVGKIKNLTKYDNK